MRTQGTALRSAGMSASNLLGPLLGGSIYAVVGIRGVIVWTCRPTSPSFVLDPRDPRDPRPGRAARPSCEHEGGAVARRAAGHRASACRWRAATRPSPRCVAANLASGTANGLLLVAVVPWLDQTLGLPTAAWGTAIAVLGGSGARWDRCVVARIGERIRTDVLVTIGAACSSSARCRSSARRRSTRLLVAFALIGCTNAALSIGMGTLVAAPRASGAPRTHQLAVDVRLPARPVLSVAAGRARRGDGRLPTTPCWARSPGFSLAAAMYWRGATATACTAAASAPASDARPRRQRLTLRPAQAESRS